jgi:hypothetical protein
MRVGVCILHLPLQARAGGVQIADDPPGKGQPEQTGAVEWVLSANRVGQILELAAVSNCAASTRNRILRLYRTLTQHQNGRRRPSARA